MRIRSPLGPHQLRWLKRIRAAGGEVELEYSHYGGFAAWVPVQDGMPVRLPMRMFESLMDRDLLVLAKDKGLHQLWKLLDDQEWETG